MVSARMPSSSRKTTGSPLRCGISTEHDLVVEEAVLPGPRGQLVRPGAENASCSSRLNSTSPVFAASVRPPIAWSVKASHSPS